MIQIQFPQLKIDDYQSSNPDYDKPMRFYLDEALKTSGIVIPKETYFSLTINDQEKDMSKDLARLQVNAASRIKIFLIIQIKITVIFQSQYDKITLNFNCFDKLLQLEKHLKNNHNLFSYKMIYFNEQNKLLDKYKSLRDQSIENDCAIKCQIIGTYQIKHMGEEKQIQINIFSTLDEVYQQIQQEFHIKQEFQLYFQEELFKKKQLNRDMLFYEYQIKPYSEIQLKFQQNIVIQLNIETLKMLQNYMVSKHLMLRDFKNYVIEECLIDKHCSYQFFVRNQKLSDDSLISQLSKQQLNEIFTLKVIEKSRQFYICGKELDSFKIRVNMNENKQIQDLLNLEQLRGLKCQFYFQDQLINKQKSFKEIHLKNKDIIYYEIQPDQN